jgi:tripartite-type tricarboxylate transporter receptor subunit TctC
MIRTCIQFCRTGFLCALGLFGGLAQAQDWPTKPIRLIVAYSPGGPVDIVARLVAKELEGAMNANFIVENRTGAAGAIGTDYVAKAAPDGYTLIVTSSAAHAVGPGIWPVVPFDPMKDFTHISLLARGPTGFYVSAESPYKTFAEFLAAAKAKPNAHHFGTSAGSLGHLTGELAKHLAGFQMQFIPYKGGAPAQADLLAGQIQVVTDAVSSYAAMLRAKKVRALAIASYERIDTFPDVPTFVELGYKDLVAYAWFGLSGPANLPPRVVERLSKASQAILAKPDVKERFKTLGMDTTPDYSPARYTAYVKGEVEKWGGVIKAANIKVEQ